MRPVLLVMLVAGCGGDKGGADTAAPKSATATYVAYNAGFAIGFVPATRARLPETAAAIGALDADIVCLQEVWTPEQVTAVSGAASGFPHQLWPDAAQVADPVPGCSDDELNALDQCLQIGCPDVCPDHLVGCFLDLCAITFLTSSPTCQSCVMANVGDDAQAVLDACATESTSYAYGGSFGTGILSKYPLSDTSLEVFDSTTNRRGVLHAVADVDGVAVDVYCTHLTADLAPLPYTGSAADWVDEQAQQIDALHAHIAATRSGPAVLMGDLNTGPAVGDDPAVHPQNWAKVEAEGWSVPFLDGGQCTLCADNPLRGEDSGDGLIDHVLLDGLTASDAVRVLDGPLTVTNCDESIDVTYSDHYGVAVTATTD